MFPLLIAADMAKVPIEVRDCYRFEPGSPELRNENAGENVDGGPDAWQTIPSIYA